MCILNRVKYFDYIDQKLHILAQRITTSGKLNMLGLHTHSENFYLHLFNLIFGYELDNLNKVKPNAEGIDLICHTNKIIIQVSSTNTKAKVESSLNKSSINDYSNYGFKFISIAKDANNLRKNTFLNPYSIAFDPTSDIFDIQKILTHISTETIDVIKKIYQFIKGELGSDIDIVKIDTNLAQIINILAKEKWDDTNKYDLVEAFKIEEKILHNDLDATKGIIDEYKLYHGRVNVKYSEFDALGHNKSNSVLAGIKRDYLKTKNCGSADDIFFAVIEATIKKITESSNFNEIPIDELELCVDILVVDAFIRCKVFENPKGYTYASA